MLRACSSLTSSTHFLAGRRPTKRLRGGNSRPSIPRRRQRPWTPPRSSLRLRPWHLCRRGSRRLSGSRARSPCVRLRSPPPPPHDNQGPRAARSRPRLWCGPCWPVFGERLSLLTPQEDTKPRRKEACSNAPTDAGRPSSRTLGASGATCTVRAMARPRRILDRHSRTGAKA
jgi:hypothetical protein